MSTRFADRGDRRRSFWKSGRTRHATGLSLASRRLAFEPLESRQLLSIGPSSGALPGMHLVDPSVDRLAEQIIYLDFDGAEDVTYNGPVTVPDIDIPAFSAGAIGFAGREHEFAQTITLRVADMLAPLSVEVTMEMPHAAEYSTMYIGGTDVAFSSYGHFYGLAETVDVGNVNRNDAGFVFSENIAAASHNAENFLDAVSYTAAHEAGHVLGYSHSDGEEDTGPLDSHAIVVSAAVTGAFVGGAIGGAVSGVSYSLDVWYQNNFQNMDNWDPSVFTSRCAIGFAFGAVGWWAQWVSPEIIASAWGASSYSINVLAGVVAEQVAPVLEDALGGISSGWDALWGGTKAALDAYTDQFETTLVPLWDQVVDELGSEPAVDVFTPVSAYFSEASIDTSGMSISTTAMEFNTDTGSSWRMVNPGTSKLEASFSLDSVPDHAVLSMTHLTSAGNMPSGGYSPIDIFVNGNLIADNLDVAEQHGGSHGFENDDFLIGDYLRTGNNTLVFEFEDNPWADTHYWLEMLVIRSGVIAPQVPTGVSATDGTYADKIEVTWNAASGAEGYDVYRNTVDDTSTATKVATLSAAAGRLYEDTSVTLGTTYYYWVKAKQYNPLRLSDFSTSDSGYAAMAAIPAPTGVSATDGTYADKIGITWNTASGAEGYDVYRNTVDDTSTATKVATLSAAAGRLYEDTSVTLGTTYYYWVKAKQYNPLRLSDFSTSDSGYAAMATIPAPTGVSATDGTYADKIEVTWNAASGAEAYDVYRNTADDTLTATKVATLSAAAGRLYEDTSATLGTTYYYWVRAKQYNPLVLSDFSTSDSGYGATRSSNLGTIAFLELPDQDPSAGDLWYSLQTTRRGYLTIEAISADTVQLALYNENRDEPPLKVSTLVNGNQRIDWHAGGGGVAYYLKLSGSNTDVDLRLANLFSDDEDAADSATVYGTDGNDTFETFGASYAMVINGVRYETEGGEGGKMRFIGGGGSDTATLTGSDGDEVVRLNPNSGTATGPGYEVQWSDVAEITVHGGGGNNLLYLVDSAGNDNFVGTPTYAAMHGQGFYNRARSFQEVYAEATAGGVDVAKFYDSPGHDLYVAAPDYNALSNQQLNFKIEATYFESVHAYATAGGVDLAKFYDSPGNDEFVATPTYAALYNHQYTGQYNQSFYNRAKFFEATHAFATASDNDVDVARLYDSPGDDQFYADPIQGALYGQAFDGQYNDRFYNRAKFFQAVHAFATGGGIDVASLHGSSDNDNFYADMDQGAMYIPGRYYNRAKFFDEVHANAHEGDEDQAQLHDLEELARWPGGGIFSHYWLYEFEYIYLDGQPVIAQFGERPTQGSADAKDIAAVDLVLEFDGP